MERTSSALPATAGLRRSAVALMLANSETGPWVQEGRSLNLQTPKPWEELIAPALF